MVGLDSMKNHRDHKGYGAHVSRNTERENRICAGLQGFVTFRETGRPI